MKDRSDDQSHHERTLLPRSYTSLHENISDFFFLNLFQRVLQCLKAGQLPEPAGSEEYTSAETGDTVINQMKTPLQGPEVNPLTPDVEVTIKPPENGEVARL